MSQPAYEIKQPHGLSPRVQWLREHYFQGVQRQWNNEWTCWTTGTPWDHCFEELSFYIVPETYAFFDAFKASTVQAARKVPTPRGFWRMSLPERRAWLVREVMVEHLPAEVLPGDLIAGARFNVLVSRGLSRAESRARDKAVARAREAVLWFHEHGYGNAGATSGHLIPDHALVLRQGFAGIHADLQRRLQALSPADRRGEAGAQLRAMLTAATMPRDLAARYARVCRQQAASEADEGRRAELERMAANLDRVPWHAPEDFWEAVQALWLSHMLVISDEGYPGPGVSFGRIDQMLLPFWQASLEAGEDREQLKEVLRCFFIHANTAYDAMIRTGGNQGITAGYGQLLTLSGLGPDGQDLTNDLTYAFLEVIDELSPLLEPKPNVRLHRGSPERLLDVVVDMVARSQGAPFLLNFDERSMAGMLREARLAGLQEHIRPDNVHDYAPVGCLENTMVGHDRSGTVDCNLNLLKALELALARGRDLVPARDPVWGTARPITQEGPDTGDPAGFGDFEQLFEAFSRQLRYLVRRCVDVYEQSEAIRACFVPSPYLSCLMGGCAESATDVTRGGATIDLVTMEGVTFATTVDSLLAIQHLVFDQQRCTLPELVDDLRDNWEGHEALRARAQHRAPKYGRDDDAADALAQRVMALWTEEVWKHRTQSTHRPFRPGMLSWNYWVADSHILAASADGRAQGRFLSNAICPSNGADTRGPTANANSVGKALGGHAEQGDWEDYVNLLPNGASHTMSFSPALLRDAAHREKMKAFLRGYARNGGTALQINVVDADMLREAQARPEDYRHLLVRVTGYNAYFTSIGRELQDELIARESHNKW